MKEEILKSSRVLQININKNNAIYNIIDELCFKSKNIYNYANYIIRQIFIITSLLNNDKEITKEQQDLLEQINSKVDEYNKNKKDNLLKKQNNDKTKDNYKDKEYKPLEYFNKNHKYADYNFMDFYTKYSEPFIDLGSASAQSTLRVLDKNWKSFFESIKDWSKNPSKYLGRPKLPKYKDIKNGRYPLYLTNNQFKIKDEFLYFAWNPLKELNNQFKIDINGRPLQLRFIPKINKYIMELVYEIPIANEKENNNRIASIDIGLNNLATVTNNISIKPFVINGRPLKSINQYFNKESSKIKSELKLINDKDWSKKLSILTDKKNNKIKDYIHKSSKYIIDWCIENNINTLVIGKNKNWKQESDMGKRTNQNFTQIPFDMLIKQLQYKAEVYGIKVITNEESYTSGTSFLDNEEPIKENYNKKRRVCRGLFISNKGIKINSDVNGSYQIMKKVFPKAFAEGIEGVGLHPIIISL